MRFASATSWTPFMPGIVTSANSGPERRDTLAVWHAHEYRTTGTPRRGFAGLKPDDRWCLCAPRWQEALEAGKAPRVVLRATHEGALNYCSLADLKRFAVDLA